ncbi:MAG: ABC transporter permease, partial [Chloroflexi bacterium]
NALPSTLELATSAFFVALLVGLSLGGLSAIPRSSVALLPSLLTNLLLSVPIYWTGTLILFLFNAPSQGGLFAPMLLLGLHTSAPIARVFATSLKQTRLAPYIFAARAKGLRPRRLWLRHALPLALLPTLSVIGLQAGFLLAGTVITEILFQRRGVGRLLLSATLEQDYPLVQGVVILAATTYTLANTITAFIQRLIDPRIETAS